MAMKGEGQHKSSRSRNSGILRNIESLAASLASEDGGVRERARAALVMFGEHAVGTLVESLTHRNHVVRWEAAKALGEIRSPSAVPALVKALQDKAFDVRWVAAEALIFTGRPAIEPLLKSLVENPESVWLREGAHHILNHFAGGDRRVEHHREVHPPLEDREFERALRPVVAALEDAAAALVAVPAIARTALEEVKTADTEEY